MLAWLTKNSIPSDRVDYVLSLPNDEEWRADFLGALFLLTQPQNWELDQGLTPDEMSDEWNRVFDDFNQGVFAMIPVGCYVPFAGSVVPGGWLLCDGAAISRSAYSALFAVIGVAHGVGDGSTTFNLPNIKGRVVVGRDSGQTEFDVLGEVGGSKTHTLVVGEIPSHGHTQNAHNHLQSAHTHFQDSHNHLQNNHSHTIFGALVSQSGTDRRTLAATSGAQNVSSEVQTPTNVAQTATNQSTTPTNTATTATNQNAGGDGAHANLQPYQVGNWIIRY